MAGIAAITAAPPKAAASERTRIVFFNILVPKIFVCPD
jgi:hypothetical protein